MTLQPGTAGQRERVHLHAPARIWLVDDSALEAEHVNRSLPSDAFAVSLYADGGSVLERLALSPPPDVLVLDWLLPGMSGIEVCRFLRANPVLRDIPVLMLTARATQDDLVEALEAGADDYIAKPFNPRELQARLTALLRRRGVPRDAGTARSALRALLDCMPNAAIALDADGAVVLANADAESLFSSRSALTHARLGDLVSDADAVASLTASHVFADQEIDGRTYAPTLRPLPPESPAAAAIVFRDVTSQRRVEAALRRSEAHLRSLLDSPLFGVLFWTADGSITEASETFLSMLGYARRDLESKALRWSDIAPSESVALDEKAFAQVRESGTCEPYERDFVRKDGSRVPVRMGVSGLDGVSHRGIAFTVETSAQKQAEAEVRSRDEFLGMLSHEMRTPTNAILGWSQVLRSVQVPQKPLERGLDAIQRNAQLQARIIEDLLEVSRAINGKLEVRPTRVDLEPLLMLALDTIRPVAQSRTLTLTGLEPGEPLIIDADPARLQQVLLNLLSNAVKFTNETGEIEIRCRRDGSRVEIAVIDDGVGIEPALLPHVFERFRQGARVGRSQSSGLGLGLAIAENLVRLHGGTIDALSDGTGFGATFLVRLPIA